MTTKSTNLQLNLADHDDIVDYDVHLNQNWNTLDTKIASIEGDIQNITPANLDSLEAKVDSLLYAPDNYEWTAAAGQLTYILPPGTTYDPTTEWMEVYVGGTYFPPDLVKKDDKSQFTLLIDSSVIQEGMKIVAKWENPYVPTTNVHHTTHEKGGTDELDITKLLNYQEVVVTPLNTANEQLADMSTELFGNKNKVKGIAITIDNSYSTALVDTWKSLLADVDCEIELVTLEFITNANSIDFTPYSDMLNKINYVIANIGKPIRMIKPHIVTQSGGDSFYRGNYLPSDMAGFFTNWTNRLKAYAQICKDNAIPVLCISCEQTNQTVVDYLSQWKQLISDVKSVNSSIQLTVAYTHFEVGRDLFQYKDNTELLLNNVDIVGYNLYPYLLRKDTLQYIFEYPDPNGTQPYNDNKAVRYYDNQLIKLKYRFNKPVYITETGCTDYSNSTSDTINPIYSGSTKDTTDQHIFMSQILDYFMNHKTIDGIFLWHISEPFALLSDSTTKNTIKNYFNQGGETQ